MAGGAQEYRIPSSRPAFTSIAKPQSMSLKGIFGYAGSSVA